MKAISVQQPFANDIIEGRQGIECRSWRIHKLPQRIAIVSGKYKGNVNKDEIDNYLYGFVLGTVAVEDCYWVNDSWEWILCDPVKIMPFPAMGKMGLFNIPDELIKYATISPSNRYCFHT